MTIQQALDRIDMMRPNMVSKAIKIAALSELDGLIWKEIIQNHEDGDGKRPMTPMEQIILLSPEERTYDGTHGGQEEQAEGKGPAEYTVETDPGTELIAQFPYDEMYLWWLASKVDWQNQELDKYNNDRTLFNNAYDTYSDWYTRTHMPKQRVREFKI